MSLGVFFLSAALPSALIFAAGVAGRKALPVDNNRTSDGRRMMAHEKRRAQSYLLNHKLEGRALPTGLNQRRLNNAIAGRFAEIQTVRGSENPFGLRRAAAGRTRGEV